MIWLSWRQARAQIAVIGGAAAAMLLFLLFSKGGMPAFDEQFLQAFKSDRLVAGVYSAGVAVGLCLPAIIGAFWGAPLVARELEAGTHRLAWNQSVTRTRWLATKLAVTGLFAMAIAGVLGLAMTWWSSSLDKAINAGQEQNGIFGVARLAPQMFDARGITPIAYTAFALVLGTLVGTLVRRTVPAMAITLALFVAVQIATPMFVREHLGATSTTSVITAENLRGLMISAIGPDGTPVGPVEEVAIAVDSPGAWKIANQTLDRAGRVQSELPSWVARCVPAMAARGGGGEFGPAESAACFKRLRDEGYRQKVTYMPASRYWTLQWIETGIFLALTALLAGATFWWLRHRVG
jgi:hypothetical protein